ncbi:titin-like [Gambusia affinis]|uniref:titin-like n=1 Tax=Gambusia affinis TaxID=33528 RepID=UPI001CDBAFB7|nr:titin-like [Gambusia affinis]
MKLLAGDIITSQHVNMENQNSSPQQKSAWTMEHWHNACSNTKQRMTLRPATTKAEHRKRCKKRRESAKKAASELETLSNETVSEANREHQGIPVPEPVGDQRAKNEIYSIETIIGKLHQVTEEETICTTQQGEDQRDERKATKKSKRKNQRKAAMKAACELETVNKEKVSVKNKEQEEVSMLEIVKDQRASIIIEVHKNKTVIDKLQQATEDEMVPEKQPIGDQQVEKRPLTKSKCKKKRKTAVKSEMENNSNPIVTDQNLVQNTETPKPDVETAPEIPQTALQQIEIKPVIVSEDVADKDPVVLTKKLRTSPPQTKVTVNEDRIQRPQQSETQPAEESDEQNKVSEEEESPKTKISLWRRIKKALTPSCLHQFKGRSKGHPA